MDKNQLPSVVRCRVTGEAAPNFLAHCYKVPGGGDHAPLLDPHDILPPNYSGWVVEDAVDLRGEVHLAPSGLELEVRMYAEAGPWTLAKQDAHVGTFFADLRLSEGDLTEMIRILVKSRSRRG